MSPSSATFVLGAHDEWFLIQGEKEDREEKPGTSKTPFSTERILS
jgi:hypothetical protein